MPSYIIGESDYGNESSINYVCIATNKTDTKSNPSRNHNHNPTTKQHAEASIQPNIQGGPKGNH